jgi:hypothetical protein
MLARVAIKVATFGPARIQSGAQTLYFIAIVSYYHTLLFPLRCCPQPPQPLESIMNVALPDGGSVFLHRVNSRPPETIKTSEVSGGDEKPASALLH